VVASIPSDRVGRIKLASVSRASSAYFRVVGVVSRGSNSHAIDVITHTNF
jgi:hypothetical protein